MTYYEAHITMLGDPDAIRPHVLDYCWKFSAIDGDPSLGDGVKCYATYFFNARQPAGDVVERLIRIADALTKRGCNVIRRKVELVIFDDRSDKVRCDGTECANCDDSS